ncbi:MAG: hypothetical protein K2X69_03420 [Silvanigrellaceae bacterium]|nr:hypothetical protein [Silvanigrellaceae bacterium]
MFFFSLSYTEFTFANCCFVTIGQPNNPNQPLVIIPPNGNNGGGTGEGVYIPNALDINLKNFTNANDAIFKNHINRENQKAQINIDIFFKNSAEIEKTNRETKELEKGFPTSDFLKPFTNPIEPINSEPSPKDSTPSNKLETTYSTNSKPSYGPFSFIKGGLDQAKRDLNQGIYSTKYSEAESQIRKGVDYFVKEKLETNIQYKSELNQATNIIFNDNGLIKDYLEYYPKLKNYSLKTQINSVNSSNVKLTLNNINSALHIIKNSYSPQSIEKAKIVIENSIKADIFYANNLKIQSNRLLGRGISSLTFYANKQNEIYQHRTLSVHAKNLFDVDANLKATTSYENYQIINLANGLAKELSRDTNYQNMEYYTLSNIALKQAQSSSMDSDLNKFESALDNAWAYADIMYDVNRGVAKGLLQVLEDSLTGVYHLITQPVDSYLSLSSAIYNYDKTYEIITNNIKNDINNFPNLSIEEKAKLITQSSIEIATLITPRGLLKNSVELKKIADASTFASTKVVDHYAKVLKAKETLPPNPDFVRNTVPGGSLFKHEEYRNGHTIIKHVDQSNADMKNRAINEKRMEISSFSNLNIAEQAIANTIIQNKVNIDNWIRDPKVNNKKPFNSTAPANYFTGTSYNRVTDQFSNVTNTKVVLVKDNKLPEGYRILTAFPIK